ncbi:MAG: hypothetical protein ABSG43_06485 [Solirubrobacteraceae bacterium]|jgi:hypothetical protein
MLARADESYRTVTDRTWSAVRAVGTIARYGAAWPIFITRETLAAWDDVLAFLMNLILGGDWHAGGYDDARRSRRRRAG